MNKLSCFKSYDIRGKLNGELNEYIAYRIGRAYAELFKPYYLVIGGDSRLSSKKLKKALSQGLNDAGVEVLDIGLSGTEEIYFATSYLQLDGGIEVTASHSPIDYNGMKLVYKNSKPININTGLQDIEYLVNKDNFFSKNKKKGNTYYISILTEYVDYILNFINLSYLTQPIKLVVNSGNGAAGHVIDVIETKFQALNIPISFIKMHHQPNGNFPHGIPNPLLPQYQKDIKQTINANNANIGVAFDGDFDRCCFFDENGNFVESYYIIGLFANFFLKKHPKEKIIYDSRLMWNTLNVVHNAGGTPILSKIGHSFIKEAMRCNNAIYGGEISAHHYFRDFFYCDSGMIPWLLVLELMNIHNQPLSMLIEKMKNNYPSSGEINYQCCDTPKIITTVLNKYRADALRIDYIDGISLSFVNWRFNLRSSNTESKILRLNIESFHDSMLITEKINEINNIIMQ